MDKIADEAKWCLKEAPDVARHLAQHEAHPLIQRLFAYWSRLPRPDDGYPARKDLDPTQIGTGLPWIWMADIVGHPLRFRHRLVGTAHGKALGTDVTGKWLEEASPAFHNSASYADLVRVATQGVISYRHGELAPEIRTVG
ncbi:MAG TPA: PAS domain-containing protein [Aliidongia sp.]|uniref:PAS domain-containing protein n=1 Tax=Aliidongia sp. TaxID=1914230 RepID=UPI002DDCE967|nr:PAS domain-containing protein [Aliidongia sp.]HEV2674352.1 PAS domain-containing protein [Aliidongia sp.]